MKIESGELCMCVIVCVYLQDKTCAEFQELRTYIWSQAALRDK